MPITGVDFNQIFEKAHKVAQAELLHMQSLRRYTLEDIYHIGEIIETCGHIKHAKETHSHTGSAWIVQMIEEELGAAEMYYEEWIKDKTEAVRQIARDETRHADYWIKSATKYGLEEPKIEAYRKRLTQVQQKIG